jgi:hypothetical protein
MLSPWPSPSQEVGRFQCKAAAGSEGGNYALTACACFVASITFCASLAGTTS